MNFVNELFNFLSQQEIEETVRYDDSPKEVGDTVELVDDCHLNYFMDVETEQQLSHKMIVLSNAIKDIFKNQKMVVVANNITKEYNCGHCEQKHYHDMIVYLPQLQKKYYCSAKEVRVVK